MYEYVTSPTINAQVTALDKRATILMYWNMSLESNESSDYE